MGQLSVDLSAKMESLKTKAPKKTKTGIAFPRYFTAKLESGKTPYDEIQWETRTASIGNDKGSVIFEQRENAMHRWCGVDDITLVIGRSSRRRGRNDHRQRNLLAATSSLKGFVDLTGFEVEH